MQTRNRILDDLAKVANGAVSTLAGVKDEVDALVRQRLERFLSEMDLVPREEFEVVKAIAIKARSEQEKLARQVKKLEGALKAKRKPAAKTAKPRMKASAKKSGAVSKK